MPASHRRVNNLGEFADAVLVCGGANMMPPNDGCWQSRFVMLTERGAKVERLNFDVQGVVAAMQSVGLKRPAIMLNWGFP